jgi:hypothetical protein
MNREQFNKQLIYMSVLAKLDSAFDVLTAIEPTFEHFSEYKEIPLEYRTRIVTTIDQIGDLLCDMEKYRNEQLPELFEEVASG